MFLDGPSDSHLRMVTPDWVFALMLKGQPQKTPWMDTYRSSAEAIAEAAAANPLFEGSDGDAKTAAVMVGVAIPESALRPDAVGDQGTSYCLFQVNRSNFRGLGVTEEQMRTDVRVCASAGLRMMHMSFRVCRHQPLKYRLSWYAAGRDGCAPNSASERRVGLGMRLFEQVPPPRSEWEAAALAIRP